jgi:hypothetical protein
VSGAVVHFCQLSGALTHCTHRSGPVFGFQGVMDALILPAMISVVNDYGADGILFPSVMGFSAVNAQLLMVGDVAEFAADLVRQPFTIPATCADVTGDSL